MKCPACFCQFKIDEAAVSALSGHNSPGNAVNLAAYGWTNSNWQLNLLPAVVDGGVNNTCCPGAHE